MPSTGSKPSGSRVNRQPRSSRIGSTVPSEIASSSPSRPRDDQRPVRPRAGPAPDQPVTAGLQRPAVPLVRAAAGRRGGVGGDPTGEPVRLADERAAAAGLCAELGPGHAVNLSAAGADILAAGSPVTRWACPTPAVRTP